MRDAYVALVQQAAGIQDTDETVRLLQDPEVEFWIRRDGLETVMDAADDLFAITVFNRLFLPLAEDTGEETYHLLDWWLMREERAASPQRLAFLRHFLFEMAEFPHLPERVYGGALGLLAIWTQQENTLAGWSEATEVTKRLLATYRQHAPRRLAEPRVLRAALWSGDLGLIRAIAEIAATTAETADERLMVHYLISILISFADRTALRPLTEAMHEKDPALPVAIHNLAQVYAAECRDATEIAALYWPIDEQLLPGQFRLTLDWIGQYCYDKGYGEVAARLFAMLPETSAQGMREMSWPQKVLQGLTDAAPEHAPDPAALLAVEGLPRVLAQPLEQAAFLAHGDMTWRAALTPQMLAAKLQHLAGHIRALPASAHLLAHCERAAQRMIALSRKYFEPHKHYADVSPIPLAEKYGRIDIERLRAAYTGLNAIAAAVAELGLKAILDGTPIHPVDKCLHLLDNYATAHLAGGTAEAAVALLTRFKHFEPCNDFVSRLLERCFLAQGKIAAAEALLTPEERARSAIYELADRDRWTRAEGLAWQPLFEGMPGTATFEVSNVDGRVITYNHKVPAVNLAMTTPGMLTVRRGEIIRGQNDVILRPQKLHYPTEYPRDIPDVLAWGDGAVRLMRLGAVRDVTEPVVVMENFDALLQRNYYHWLVLLLARINHLKMRGLLDGRRLLVPEGLSPWMLASCAAIGVRAEDMLVAPLDTELRLTDALLVSSVEFASPVLLQDLRTALLQEAATAPAPEDPLYIYISRKGHTRRAFINDLEIESIARGLGFTILHPETLPFLEQVQLFRRAAGVAGPEGAAFANTVFCDPGTKTLALLNENDLFPTFNDIAATMGLKHRKLTGKAELDGYGANFLWAPYRIDPALAERDLRWTMAG